MTDDDDWLLYDFYQNIQILQRKVIQSLVCILTANQRLDKFTQKAFFAN